MPLERMSTAQHVAESLREQLLRGDIPPGSRIPEEDVAADLQVSRNSVREGLQILVSEGLVHRSLHRGAVVSELTREQLSDVYQARRVIEVASIRIGMRYRRMVVRDIGRARRHGRGRPGERRRLPCWTPTAGSMRASLLGLAARSRPLLPQPTDRAQVDEDVARRALALARLLRATPRGGRGAAGRQRAAGRGPAWIDHRRRRGTRPNESGGA